MDRRQFSRLRHGAAAQQGADQNNKSWRQKLKEMKEKNKELSADNNVMKERCSWMKEQIEKKYKKFQEQISALEVSLVEMSRTENSYKKTVAHFYQKHLKALNSDWEKRWSLGQDEAAARLQETQAACNLKVKALEDQLRSNLAAKEVCLQREQELQSQSSKMKEELSDKVSQKEQEIKLLTQQNSDLQEFAQKTDKEKAKIRKAEQNAKKQAENRLKKEKRQNEKRGRKGKKKRRSWKGRN